MHVTESSSTGVRFSCFTFQNFRQPIDDTNNHDPEFDEDSYTYQMPMPLAANFEISYFGPQITVTDLDISNTNIIFSMNTEDFIVETEGPVDELQKQFRPRIITNKALRYTESQTFILTATVSCCCLFERTI